MLSQSSRTKCRSLVMLGCLVTVPLIAMFGTSLPEETPREVATTRSASPGPKSEADLARAEVIPASYQSSGQWEDQRGEPPAGEPGPPMVADDRLATVQRHLEQLGATYYRLESWGNEGPRFRFECRVAFDRNSDCARHFEATDRDAMQAIAKVVRQVEAWVAAQRTRTGG